MIESHGRIAKIAGIACVVSMSLLFLPPLLLSDVKSVEIDLVKATLGLIILISFFVSLWYLLKAKGRSEFWLLLLFLNVVGLVIIFLLKDLENNTEGIKKQEILKEDRPSDSREVLMTASAVKNVDWYENISKINSVKFKLMTSRFLDVVCFVVAPALIVVNSLSIRKNRDNSDYILWIGIGVAFISFGLLRKYWTAQNKK